MQTIRRIDLDDAHLLMTAARQRAQEIGVPMCIAITDEAGNLIAFERMEGGKITSITIAIDKAFTAAAARKATHDYGSASQPGGAAWGISSAIGGRLMVVAGGLPVTWQGEVVGGIGISSGTPPQDRDVAEAAVAAFIGRQTT